MVRTLAPIRAFAALDADASDPDLSDRATTLYSSDSVIDVLGYTPDELVSVSAWDLFHPVDVHLARAFHDKKVMADKAAVLVYCRIKDRQGHWIGCECCFSIVYDVMVACTSIYKRGLSSESQSTRCVCAMRKTHY